MNKAINFRHVLTISLLAWGTLLLMPSPADAAGLVTVRYVNSHYKVLLTKLPQYIAEKKGFFRKNGVTVDFVSGGGGGQTLRVLSTGNVDMAEGGLTAAILAAHTDPNIELVGAWNHSASSFAWIAPKDTKVHSVADLKGAKLGYSHPGSASQRLAEMAIQRAGIGDVKFVSVGGMGDNWAAARAGVITAGWCLEPFLSEKVDHDHARIVLKPGDYVKHFYVEGIDVNAKFAAKHPEAVKGVFRGLSEAVQFMKTHPKEAAEIGAKRYHTSVKIISAGIRRYMGDGVWNLKMDPKAFDTVIESMVQSGQLDHRLDIGKLLNQSYLPSVDRTKMN